MSGLRKAGRQEGRKAGRLKAGRLKAGRPKAGRPKAGRSTEGRSKPRRVRGGEPFIVLTGLSGSGKSQAIRALEDLGYFCDDNLPTTLIPTLAKLSMRGGRDIDKVAIVVDVREGG